MSPFLPEARELGASPTPEENAGENLADLQNEPLKIHNNKGIADSIFRHRIETYKDVDNLPKNDFVIPITYPDGTEKTLSIPKATWSEKRTLRKILKKSDEDKVSALAGALMFGNKLQIYVLMSHLYTQDMPELNVNTTTSEVNVGTSMSVGMGKKLSLLNYAGGNKDYICMLVTAGADINTPRIKREDCPIISKLQNDVTDEEGIQFFLSLGATLDRDDLKYIKHANTLEYVKELLEIEDRTPKALPESTAEEKYDITEDVEALVQKEEENKVEIVKKDLDPDATAPTSFDTNAVMQKQEIQVRLPNGGVREITIRSANEDDKEWVKRLQNMDADDRRCVATSLIVENDLWRLMVLLETARIEREQNGNTDYFDIDAQGSHDGDLTLLGHTSYNSAENVDAAAILLAYGADIEKGRGRRWTPLLNSMAGGKKKLMTLLIDNGAEVFEKDLEQASDRPEIQSYFLKKFGHMMQNHPHENLNDPALLAEYDFTGTKWQKMDDYTIAKVTYSANRTCLNKIFNFRAQEIERFKEVLDRSKNVISVTDSILEDFASVAVKDEIRQAHEELSAQGGTLGPVSNYTNHARQVKKRR